MEIPTGSSDVSNLVELSREQLHNIILEQVAIKTVGKQISYINKMANGFDRLSDKLSKRGDKLPAELEKINIC